MAAMAPAGLSEVLVGVTAGEVLAQVAAALVHDLLAFESQGFAAFPQRFARLDALAGQRSSCPTAPEGLARGVDAEGALLVQTGKACAASPVPK
jgi:BirA family transcriptional regulator, biotin operon repressor / biotin---[acetyl-CoA-carboxylase] ligase